MGSPENDFDGPVKEIEAALKDYSEFYHEPSFPEAVRGLAAQFIERLNQAKQWSKEEKSLLNAIHEINIESRTSDVYYSIYNSQEVNNEIYDNEIQVIHDKWIKRLKDVEKTRHISSKLIMMGSRIENELSERAKLGRGARELQADYLRLKALLDNPEKIAKLQAWEIKQNFTRKDLHRLIYLERKYFSDSPINKYLWPIMDKMLQNEKLYAQIYEKWSQFDRQRSLLQEMNQRLDRQHGDEPRESLLIKTNRALQNKGNVNERSTTMVETQGRSGSTVDKQEPER
ncbi:MAG: hypothetical protein PHS83_04080 [Clostridia bacterium]|nr:hypothetical protein [Clostridia bacterium]MDD4146260.1 hypothetical protein [Clostridia bacterium]